jgi:hypothetical protein
MSIRIRESRIPGRRDLIIGQEVFEIRRSPLTKKILDAAGALGSFFRSGGSH